MSGAVWVAENMVGALNSPQCPPGPLKLLDQFFAVHVCIIHTSVCTVHIEINNFAALREQSRGAFRFLRPFAIKGPRAGHGVRGFGHRRRAVCSG